MALLVRDGAQEIHMATVNLRRINFAAADAVEQIAALRARLSPQGDVVSARGRKLTEGRSRREFFGPVCVAHENKRSACGEPGIT